MIFDRLKSLLANSKNATKERQREKYLDVIGNFNRINNGLQCNGVATFTNNAFIPFLIGNGIKVKKTAGGFIAYKEMNKNEGM